MQRDSLAVHYFMLPVVSPKSLENSRYLGLCGCILGQDYYRRNFIPDMQKLKDDFWGDDPDFPVIFHREDIIKKANEFQLFKDVAELKRFNGRVVSFYREQKFTVVTVVIDKESHVRRYVRPDHPYHYCLTALLERFCLFLRRRRRCGDIIVEARGKREDELLREEWRGIRQRGTRFVKPSEICSALPNSDLEFRRKCQNLAGLQLADLLANPTTQDVLIEYGEMDCFRKGFAAHVCGVIQEKYDCNQSTGKTRGFGKVLLK